MNANKDEGEQKGWKGQMEQQKALQTALLAKSFACALHVLCFFLFIFPEMIDSLCS